MPDSSKIVLIGAGNVATVLGKGIYARGFIISCVISPNITHAESLAKEIHAETFSSQIKQIPLDADWYILAVSDDAIEVVMNEMPIVDGIVVHTSGTVSSDGLKRRFSHWGVWYPLQTMSKERPLALEQIPFLILGNSEETLQRIELFTRMLGATGYRMDDEQRRQAHLTAVILNNFVNQLILLAEDYGEKYRLPPELFKPLLIETIEKSLLLGAKNAQTGPARRGDRNTIRKHLELIQASNNTILLSLYRIFTRSIIERYGGKIDDFNDLV